MLPRPVNRPAAPTPGDLAEIQTAASAIEVRGARYPEHLERMTVPEAPLAEGLRHDKLWRIQVRAHDLRVCLAREKSDEQMKVLPGRPQLRAATSACWRPSSDSPQDDLTSLTAHCWMTFGRAGPRPVEGRIQY